ncbi:MAG: AarF/ABC1/UbiB kinase family protein [Anaerolineae bacterium]|nr:AarF/ABC1/UbiB kinase family protein [Anaerolineae bacterium]
MINFPVTRRLSHLRRYQEMLGVFARHGFGSALDLLPVERKWIRRLRPYPVSELQTLPAHFRIALEELGPTFVKLGQILSTRPDLLPPVYVSELSRLQDKVAPVPWKEIREVIKNELGAPPETIFDNLDPTPIAAASLGQVHAATLQDGAKVVVKVQRPNILHTIEVDLQILEDLAHYVQRHTPLGDLYELEEFASDFANTLKAELNYLREGRNADRFRKAFRGERYIYIPEVHWQYTTQRVLVLERIEGIKITDIGALQAAGFDLDKLALHAARMSVKEILEDGFFHADPHPGNLFVMESGAIGVMDFGMTGLLSEQDRINLARLYGVAVQLDAEGVVDELIHIRAAPPDVDRGALARDIHRLLRQYHGLPLKAIHTAEVIQNIRPIVFEHRLHLPSNYWLLAKSLVMMEGIGRRLAPEFDIFAFSQPQVARLALRALTPSRRTVEQLFRQGLVWSDLFNALPRTGLRLLNRLEQREPIPLSLDKRSLDRLDTLVTRLALSLIVAGMIIGIAIMTPAISESNTFVRVMLGLAFVVSLGLGLGIVFSILRRR